MRRTCQTLAALALGGCVGAGLDWRRLPDALPWKREPANAAESIQTSRPNEIMKFGFPGSANLKMRGNYVLSYDTRCRNPNWVFEHLNKELIVKTKDSAERESCKFIEDESIPSAFRATNEDFFHSGFDRGHLAAAANHRANQHWMDETFLLSNVSPQHKYLNQVEWNRLEKFVRGLVHHYDDVYVCSGPLYLPRKMEDGKMYVIYQVLEPNHVAVPTHFFKIVLGQKKGKFDIRCYVMPNQPNDGDEKKSLDSYLFPINAVEKASGLLMFSGVPKNAIRSVNKPWHWRD